MGLEKYIQNSELATAVHESILYSSVKATAQCSAVKKRIINNWEENGINVPFGGHMFNTKCSLGIFPLSLFCLKKVVLGEEKSR